MGGERRQPIALYAWFLLGSLCLTGTARAAVYSFDEQGYLGEATLMPNWRDTLDRQRQESILLHKCLDAPAGCPSNYKALQHLLQRAQALSEDRQITLVNHYVNRKRYKIDRARTLTTDLNAQPLKYRSRWSTVSEFIQRGGDCEDYATTKYFLLREIGIPAERLRVVVAYDRESRGHHALLAVRRTDGSVWLLDSDDIIRPGNRQDYRFVYSLNESSIWDHEARELTSTTPKISIHHEERTS